MDPIRIEVPLLVLPDAAILAGQLAPSSIAEYRTDIAGYLAWCQVAALPALAAPSLAQWRTHQAKETTLSAATINRALAAVKRLVKEAASQGYLHADLAAQFHGVAGVKAKALKERQRSHARTRITPADMRRLQDAPDRTTLKGLRDAALLAVLAGSGLRASEAAGLTVGMIRKAGQGWLLDVIGKGQSEAREALLSGEAHRLLLTWLAARPVLSQYVFTAFGGRGASRATGAPMSATSIWRTVQAYAVECSLAHIKPHDLRRFLGTQLAKTDIRKAQKALGHKSIETTARHYVLDELEAGLSDGLY